MKVKNFYKIKSVCFQTNGCPLEIPIKGIKKIMEYLFLQLKNLVKTMFWIKALEKQIMSKDSKYKFIPPPFHLPDKTSLHAKNQCQRIRLERKDY